MAYIRKLDAEAVRTASSDSPATTSINPTHAEALAGGVRRAMRHVGSTVTIITTRNDQPFGMVATAFMSLSLEPPSLVVAINESASICRPLLQRGAFCVNVLSGHDEGVSRRFTQLSGADRFTAGNWEMYGEDAFAGIPYLKSAQVSFFCEVGHSLKNGSHQLIVGKIRQLIDRQADDPLLYCDGAYGSFRANGEGAAAQLDDRLFLCN
jgi:flavin reductase (DIM6/NTAB) family NADH-FMN oxidoreductase RutF